MMKCFYYFKQRSKKSKTTPKSSPVSAPTSTLSNNGTGTGQSPTSTKQISKSSGSTSVSMSSPRSIPALYEERAHNLRVFDIKELIKATNNFSRLLKIGEGGFGSVYKGYIKGPNGQGDPAVVAIKKLNQNGLQGHKQWLAEVQFLGVVEHSNLVKLIGYCAIDGERGIQRLLVYEYMPNKSLEDHLFNKAYPPLSWNTRLKVAMGAAEGLTYLHEGLEVQVIYRDFKASNVLLNKEFKPKLSDFGLAREGPTADRTHVTTAVVGTYGYAAPDYIQTGHLTIKSDVWSFGVVLYEILTGRRSLERNRPRGEQKLLDWVKEYPVDSKRFFRIMDPRLGNQYSLSAARMIARLANACLSKSSKDRPAMSEVVDSLKSIIDTMETGVPTETADERCSTDSDNEKKLNEEEVGAPESSKREEMCDAELEKYMGYIPFFWLLCKAGQRVGMCEVNLAKVITAAEV